MNQAVVEYKEHRLTAADIRENVNLVQEVMKAVMKEGTHFGKIPGTPKPSLWKPGAEVLASTFRIAPSFVIDDLTTEDCIRYRLTCTGTHQTTGIVMGAGVGEASSNEEKYKWRRTYSNKEFETTPENRRRVKYGYDKDTKKEYEIKQVRTEPADVANTILKMAAKRSQVAMTLNVVAASDIFTQDIEDLPEELQHDIADENGGKKTVQQPQSKSGAAKPKVDEKPITAGALNILRAKLKSKRITEEQICKHFGAAKAEDFFMSFVNELYAYIDAQQTADASNPLGGEKAFQ